jgi:hypothetical protein
MKEIRGWVVAELDGTPMRMELSNDIVGGLIVTDPFPIFDDSSDARDAGSSNRCRFVGREHDPFLVVPAVITFDLVAGKQITPDTDDESDED